MWELSLKIKKWKLTLGWLIMNIYEFELKYNMLYKNDERFIPW